MKQFFVIILLLTFCILSNAQSKNVSLDETVKWLTETIATNGSNSFDSASFSFDSKNGKAFYATKKAGVTEFWALDVREMKVSADETQVWVSLKNYKAICIPRTDYNTHQTGVHFEVLTPIAIYNMSPQRVANALNHLIDVYKESLASKGPNDPF